MATASSSSGHGEEGRSGGAIGKVASSITGTKSATDAGPGTTCALAIRLGEGDPLGPLKLQMAPRGMQSLFTTDSVMGALRWRRTDRLREAEGRPRGAGTEAPGEGGEGGGQPMELVPVADGSLVLVAAVAASGTMGEVIGAMSAAGRAPSEAWRIIRRACMDALSLLPLAENVADEAIRAALAARQDLLSEAAAAISSTGEALEVNGDDDKGEELGGYNDEDEFQ